MFFLIAAAAAHTMPGVGHQARSAVLTIVGRVVGADPMSDAGVILLVEDDSADVLLLRRAFMKGGITHPLRVAPDGAEAIAYVAGSGGYADRARHPPPSPPLPHLHLPLISRFPPPS